MKGNCYHTSEALYHLFGGKEAGWKPMHLKHEGSSHWYLKHSTTNQIIDPTRSQFKTFPAYANGKGKGFLTKQPSKRAQELMKVLVWK
jgi:hypothetical protein